jgi:hypothetical protein
MFCVRLASSPEQVTSESACRLACEIENEFLCRSFIFKGPPVGTAYNCELFHLDHKTLPDGPSTYLNAERPLIDDGQKIGNYYENYCESECRFIYFLSSSYILLPRRRYRFVVAEPYPIRSRIVYAGRRGATERITRP